MARRLTDSQAGCMPGLIVAADLTALGAAAGQLGTAFSSTSPNDAPPSLGHPGADAALQDFHSTMTAHQQAIAQHAAMGAASLRGFMLAFQHAGE